MFCPKCGAYLRDSDLIQRNTKFAMGNVAVEYDAICPNCNIEIGRISWGQFTVHPELDQTRYEEVAPLSVEKESLIPPPPEMRTVLRRYGAAGRTNSTQEATGEPEDQPGSPAEQQPPRTCPHCGQPWPAEGTDGQKY